MSLPIKVPVKPYVYKILTHADFFGEDSVTLSQTDSFGLTLYRTMNVIHLDLTKEVSLPEWFTDSSQHRIITIDPKFSLPDSSYNEYNFLTISTLFEDIARNAFEMFVQGRMDKHPAQMESIRRFREIYNISEEDFKTEAFKKQAQRFRWRSVKRSKLQKNK